MPTIIKANCLDAASGIAHGFFTRLGGVSPGLYASLNCGIGSRDDRQHVIENRARVAGHLGTTAERLLTCRQVHSADTTTAVEPWPLQAMPQADAIVTTVPGLAIGVLAADCAPVLFADLQARVVGAAHAGWRGALGGILESAVAAMEHWGAKRDRIRAVLGPCIGPGVYEVGPEFEDRFLSQEPGNKSFLRRKQPGARACFDLPGYVLQRLERLGLGVVENATQCTYSNSELFFSFRRATHRSESDYGRQMSAIVLR